MVKPDRNNRASAGKKLLFGCTAAIASFTLLALPSFAEDEPAPRDPKVDFKLTDFDNNGCISWEELRNRSMVVYGEIDKDNDGIITAEELRAAAPDRGDQLPDDGSVPLTTIQAALHAAFDEEDADDSGCIDDKEWT